MIERRNHTIDATGQSVGRLAARIATLLSGKHKKTYLPRIDQGDMVLVTNAGKLHFTGKKKEQKVYRHYSGYPGGLKEAKLSILFKKDPSAVVRKAVINMLPRNSFKVARMRRLTINN